MSKWVKLYKTKLIVKKYTYKSPNVQSNWKTKVHQDKKNCCSELQYQHVNKTSLEYVSVEEQQKDDDDSKQNAHVLDAKTVIHVFTFIIITALSE